MIMINLEKYENDLIKKNDLTGKQKFQIWRESRLQNFNEIVSIVNKYDCHNFDENGVLVVNGIEEFGSPCPSRVNVNGVNFFLYKGFTMKISITRIVIYLEDVEIFNTPLKKVKSFEWNGL